jgi:selenocysteine-specific translation elongation factor
MSALTLALVGSKEAGKELGKKGTSSDLTLYHAVREGHALTVVEPTHYPEKFAPLLYALSMADRVLVVVDALNREAAETLAAVELFHKPTDVLLGPAVGEAEFRRALKGSALQAVELRPYDWPLLRETVDGWKAEARPGVGTVRLDHAFPVKGVGAVALGLVTRGTVHAHDKLRLFPDPRIVELRSIQVHDVDVKEAGAGERVGLALRGVEADELSRG